MGKARSVSSLENEAVRDQKRLSAINNQLPDNIAGPFQNFPEPQSAIPKSLLIEGGIMKGPIAFKDSIEGIVSGKIDVGRTKSGYSSFVVVQAETGTTDDLTDIDNPAFPGQKIYLQADTGDTITIKTTGNISTSDGSDFSLAAEKVTQFIYAVKSAKWQQVFGTTAGSGTTLGGLTDVTITAVAKGDMLVHNGTVWVDLTVGADTQLLTADSAEATGVKWAAGGAADNLGNHIATQALDMAGFDVFAVENIRFDNAGSAHNTVAHIFSDASGDMTFNVADTDQSFWTINGVTKMRLDIDELELRTTDGTLNNHLDFLNTDTTPADNDNPGKIRWRGFDSGGVTIFDYASLIVQQDDVTAGTIDGTIILKGFIAGTEENLMIWNGSLSPGDNISFRNFVPSATSRNLGNATLKWGTGFFNNITMGTGDIVMNNNDITGLNAIAFTDAGGQIAGSVSSPHMNFVLTGASTFRFTANAQNILDISDASGIVVVGTHNIALGNNNVTGINEISFNQDANQKFTDGVNGITYNVPTGDRHMFSVNGAEQFRVDDGLLDFFNQFVDMDNLATPANPTSGTRRLFVNSSNGELSVRTSAGATVSLEGAGGGGGESFPIDPVIFDFGTTSGTLAMKLDGSDSGDGHSFKVTMNGNVTLTFDNPPASGTQHEFEMEFVQDATGGRTVTHPASVAETVTISSGAGKVTIVTYRTNDGGTTYHAIPALRGSVDLGSTGFMTTTMSNMGTTAMSADLLPSATAIRDIGSNTLFFSDVFTGTLDLGDATDIQTLLGTSTGIVYNVKTGDSHQFAVNSINQVQIDTDAIFPSTTAVDDCGKTAQRWDNVYTGTLNLGTSSNNQTLVGSASGITYNVKTGDSHDFAVNSITKFEVDGTSINITADILPTTTALHNIGSGSFALAAIFTTNVRFNASTLFINGGASGLTFEVPTGDKFEYEINNVAEFTVNATNIDLHTNVVDNAGTINFTDGNALASSPVEMNLTFPAAADHFTWDFNSNERYEWGEGTTQFKSANGANLDWLFERIDSAPNDGDVIMQIDYQGEDSAGNPTDYVREIFTAEDITSASEAGGWKIQVATGSGSLGGGIEVRGDANTTSLVGLSFFGGTPVEKQNITGARDNPEGALKNLLTALGLFGLILDSTTAS